jgi:sugar transferase (PEP-CTERM/EpsH1 system associated)
MNAAGAIASPLVVHIVHRLAVGGMENGLINLINHMPGNHYRHAIVCLTEATDFKDRIENKAIPVIELKQTNGHDPGIHFRVWRALRALGADIIHTRNLPTIEFQLVAALAGVHGRIHGEHGRDMYDLDGKNFKYNMLRKALRPFVGHYIAVSRDLEQWLLKTIGVKRDRITQIYNGVNTDKFKPRGSRRDFPGPEGWLKADSFVVGSVGRMEAVKDQITLVRAFIHLVQSSPAARERARLVVVGDGALRQHLLEVLRAAGLQDTAWLPGERKDVAEIMRAMDLFVLPSLREGISNTILEAMATGLPVVATNTGGNPEIVTAGEMGDLVPHSNPAAMAQAIANYFSQTDRAWNYGRNARRKVERQFSMEAMVKGYLHAYDNAFHQRQTETLRDHRFTSL